MKIAYIGHFLEKSGWGRANREYIKALHVSGAELTCLPVMLGKAAPVTEEFSFIKDLIKKDIGQPDYVIQHLLPHHMQYSGLYKKNVGFGIVETSNLRETIVPDYLNLMDEIWVPNRNSIECLNTKQKCIPHPMNIEKFSQNYPKMKIHEIDHTYKFYTVCELSRRKNIWAMVRAFFRAFTESDNVSLVIKIYDDKMSPEDLKQKMDQNLEVCKKNCRLESYPEVAFVTNYFPNDQLMGLHKYCDCFVSTSFGEAWCYPLSDALGFGNRVISSNHGGADFLNYLGCEIDVVKGSTQPYHGETDSFIGYHTLGEDCEEVSESDLSNVMKRVFKEGKEKNNNIPYLTKISHKNVGKMMLEALCEPLQD